MNGTREMAVQFNVEIPNRALAKSLLLEWSGRSGVSLNIVRGRITRDGVRYELEVRGTVEKTAPILRQSEAWTEGRRMLRPFTLGNPA
jgi:hypothetical protein